MLRILPSAFFYHMLNIQQFVLVFDLRMEKFCLLILITAGHGASSEKKHVIVPKSWYNNLKQKCRFPLQYIDTPQHDPEFKQLVINAIPVQSSWPVFISSKFHGSTGMLRYSILSVYSFLTCEFYSSYSEI